MKSKININFKKLLEPENELILIGIFAIFIFLWIILYAIPGLLSSLFNTVLGKIILLLCVILISYQNIKYGIILFIIFVVMQRFISVSTIKNKEGFTWQQSSTNKFLSLQKTINPQVIFDTNEIQKQASQDEVDFFIKNGYWPWSKQVQELFVNSLNNNPYVRTDPNLALQTIRTIYNEKAILQMLSWQAKEGQFLLNGVSVNGEKNKLQDLPNGWGDYAFDTEQITRTNKVIKCGYNKNDKKLALQQITYMGDGGVLNEHVKDKKSVDYNNLEKLIPGFSFLKGPCNPCQAIDNSPSYSCPFQLDISGSDPGVSPIWQYLWGLPVNMNNSNGSDMQNNKVESLDAMPVGLY